MVATSDFSGLVSSAWAFASAAAIVPIDSLHRCMAGLHFKKIEADRARFGALSPHPVADRFLGVLRHEGLELGLGFLVLKEGLPGAAEDSGKFGPRVRGAHVHDSHRLDPRPRRLDPEQARGLAALNTTPELFLGREKQVLVERIGGN